MGARGLLRLATAMDIMAMAVTATGMATARGLLRPSPATDMAMDTAMAVMVTDTARGLLRPATAMDITAMVVMAMDTATARGLLRPATAMDITAMAVMAT